MEPLTTEKRGKGRPFSLSAPERAQAIARLNKLRAVMRAFPELSKAKVNRQANLRPDTFGRYYAEGYEIARTPNPAVLSKLEAVLAVYVRIFDENSLADS